MERISQQLYVFTSANRSQFILLSPEIRQYTAEEHQRVNLEMSERLQNVYKDTRKPARRSMVSHTMCPLAGFKFFDLIIQLDKTMSSTQDFGLNHVHIFSSK